MARIFEAESNVVQVASRLNVPIKQAPRSTKTRLMGLSPSELQFIGENLTRLSRTFELCIIEDVSPWDDLKFLKLCVRQMGLNFASDFEQLISSDYIIEGYDMNRRQIFRNMRFMETTNYSLIELLSHDWPMLFHREKWVTDAIMKQAEQDLWSNNQTIRSQVPKHTIRELLCAPAQACEVHHKYFVPLYSGPGRPGGVLSVCVARSLDANVGVSHDNVTFL